jgi:hypothetical protein
MGEETFQQFIGPHTGYIVKRRGKTSFPQTLVNQCSVGHWGQTQEHNTRKWTSVLSNILDVQLHHTQAGPNIFPEKHMEQGLNVFEH